MQTFSSWNLRIRKLLSLSLLQDGTVSRPFEIKFNVQSVNILKSDKIMNKNAK